MKCISFSKYLNLKLCEILFLLGLTLFFGYLIIFLNNPSIELFSTLRHRRAPNSNPNPCSGFSDPTNISHIVFGLLTGVKVWGPRKGYIDSWWLPNVTRGYLFLDKPPSDTLLPWPLTSPPYRVSDDVTDLEKGHFAPNMVRMVHSILETFREGDKGIRWYIIAFDDTVLFIDNLVDVLRKYDYTKYINIGGPSETIMSNYLYSFEMGFGGGGIALSYPLAAAMAKKLRGCIKRYPYVKSADLITQFCVDEFGVSLTVEKGIHQIDLNGDISGFLSSHPQAPLISLHHLDVAKPIFPFLDKFQSVNHLMKAAKFDQSRLLQQTICYDKPRNWSLSISWGYSIHIYDKILPRHLLKRPLETFLSWTTWEEVKPPTFMFNTRDTCESIPNVLFFQSIEKELENDRIVTSYLRPSTPWKPRDCATSIGDRSVDRFAKVRVISSTTKLKEFERSECCDILHMDSQLNNADLKLRACENDEIIA